MRFSRRKRSHAGLNLTPLIDVVFLLVLFFMLTTKFMSYHAIELILGGEIQGSSATAQEIKDPKGFYIRVLGRERVTVNGLVVSTDTLKSYLKPRLLKDPNQEITVEATQSAVVQDVVTAIDQVRLAGGQHFTVAAGE